MSGSGNIIVAGKERNNVAIAGYGVIKTVSEYQYLVSLKDKHYTVFFD